MRKVLSSEKWAKLGEIFDAASSLELNQRNAFLAEVCANDDELRREVESLLEANDVVADDFLLSSPFPLGLGILVWEETRSDEMTSETTQVFEAEISVGMKLDDRYEILEKLDAGGMGEVYIARDLKLDNRLVVVKVLLKKYLNNSYVQKKFRDEANALSRVQHRNVATVYDKGISPSGEPYLVMEFVKGVTLSQFLKEQDRQLEFSEVAEIMRQIGRGVEAIHQAHLLHRDLKPKNIMIHQNPNSGEYEVKVIDFSIARDMDKSTVMGESPGTVGYMSPEQLMGLEAKYESDIFALGLIGYEVLTGNRPFNSYDRVQLLKLHKAGVKVKPSAVRPGLQKAVDQMILKALSYKASKRYQSERAAREFGDELARALTTITEPPPVPWLKWLIDAAVMLIVVLLVWLNLFTIDVPGDDIAKTRSPGLKTDAPAPIYEADFWFPTGKPQKDMVYAGIGFTVWRVRPVTAKDGAETAREIVDGAETASERIKESIADGDKLYLGIESLTGDFMPDKGGYLYVINREQYKDGSFGRARLIFPTLLTYGGQNRVKPGQPIVLPRAKGEPFNVKRSSAAQVAETFTIILSPWAFQLPESLGEKAMVLPDHLVADWEKQYGGRMYRATLRDGVGQTRTNREQAVGSREVTDGAESLTQSEPLPQTYYKGAVKIGKPAMVTVSLWFKD